MKEMGETRETLIATINVKYIEQSSRMHLFKLSMEVAVAAVS